MDSIFTGPLYDKIFLIYGNVYDMFFAQNLCKYNNFEQFLNAFLKNIGYKRIVYYSGASGEFGKYVLDEESAKLAITANKELEQNASDIKTPATIQKKKHILNPRQKECVRVESCSVANNSPQNEKNAQNLKYTQPRITPEEFKRELTAMIRNREIKTAIVLTDLRFYFDSASFPLQDYMKVLLAENIQRAEPNENICIFLANNMTSSNLNEKIRRIEEVRNYFFNAKSETMNSSRALKIGLPNVDELEYMLEYLRIVGFEGKRITYKQSEKKRLVSLLKFFTNEAEQDKNGRGTLKSIYITITYYMKNHNSKWRQNIMKENVRNDESKVEVNETVLNKLFNKTESKYESDPLEKLKNTEGWESVAKRIEEIIADYRIKKEEMEKSKIIEQDDEINISCSNMRIVNEKKTDVSYKIPNLVLMGKPGVGKTTIARLIGQIFYNEGILAKGITIEVGKDDFVSDHVGGTVNKTRSKVEDAQDGVLFIDDAYSLYDKSDEHNYSKEAIDTLVRMMTDPRYRFCLIMAGYPGIMEKLWEMNEGLKSRFDDENIITIEDYKPDLLQKIFVKNCENDGYHFIEDKKKEEHLDLELFFKNLYNQRNRFEFANARTVINLANNVKARCNLRDVNAKCILKDDFGDYQKYFIKRDISSIDEIYEQIDSYVGMDHIKKLFREVQADVVYVADCKKRGIIPQEKAEHFIFSGNPGTGKTTMGKMMGEFFHVIGALGGSETYFVDASEIIGTHVGESAENINRIMKTAMDKNQLLYIDEAYQISDSLYGKEVMGAMMTKMTENVGQFKVVFGMYSEKVEEFLKTNPGMSSRIKVVEFPDYTPEQLLEIFDRTVKAQGFNINNEAHERVKMILKRKYDTRGKDFANAREVINIFNDMRRNIQKRLWSETGISASDASRYEFMLEDIPQNLLNMVEDLVHPKTLEEIMEELNQQIGMSELKDIVKKKRIDIEYARKIGNAENLRPGYYFFLGNPGTGKTTGAELFAKCLHKLGVVKTNKFIKCTAKDLIAGYVGQTDKKTSEVLEKSRNGVLFIDEAYMLAGSDHGENSFKNEALTEIVAFMDNPENRKTCCIIMAGYEKDMSALYSSNEGMRSRIEPIHFSDYTAEEAFDIFALFCKKGGYKMADGVRENYLHLFEKLKAGKYYANGRTARTVFEKTLENLRHRVVSGDVSVEDAKCIVLDDLLDEKEAMQIVCAPSDDRGL